MLPDEAKSEELIKTILDMAVICLKVVNYRETAKQIILTYKNIDTDVEFPLSRMFYDKYVDAKRDREFLQEFMKAQVSRRTIYAFVHYLEEGLLGLDEDGSFQYILRLEEGLIPEHHYFQVGVSDASLYYVKESEEEWKGIEKPFFEYADASGKEWNEITKPFFEMVENNAIPRKTLEEVFGDLLKAQEEK